MVYVDYSITVYWQTAYNCVIITDLPHGTNFCNKIHNDDMSAFLNNYSYLCMYSYRCMATSHIYKFMKLTKAEHIRPIRYSWMNYSI